jgi:dihydroneopterin aldolase
MADHVFIDGLEVECIIGTQPWERGVRQTLRLDLDVEAYCRPAGSTDDLSRALDYAAVAAAVRAAVETSSHQLVETVAEESAALILRDFPIALAVTVRVTKSGAVPGARAVGVVVTRRRGAGA